MISIQKSDFGWFFKIIEGIARKNVSKSFLKIRIVLRFKGYTKKHNLNSFVIVKR